MLSTAMKYVIIVLVSLIAALSGCGYYLYKETTRLSGELSTVTTSLDAAIKDVDRLKDQRKDDQTSVLLISTQIGEIKDQQYKLSNLLDKYKPRKGTVLSKPGLVEKKINAATEKYRQDLYCASGGVCQ